MNERNPHLPCMGPVLRASELLRPGDQAGPQCPLRVSSLVGTRRLPQNLSLTSDAPPPSGSSPPLLEGGRWCGERRGYWGKGCRIEAGSVFSEKGAVEQPGLEASWEGVRAVPGVVVMPLDAGGSGREGHRVEQLG